MNPTASTSTQSSAKRQNLGDDFKLPLPVAETGLARLVGQLRRLTGLTEAGLFWFSYAGLIGLVAFAALG